jgi:hypothetical protein
MALQKTPSFKRRPRTNSLWRISAGTSSRHDEQIRRARSEALNVAETQRSASSSGRTSGIELGANPLVVFAHVPLR